MHVLNTEYFGQVMLPLDWHHNLHLEEQQFSYMRNEALGNVNTKDVNEYLNRYSNIRMGIRIIFEYSMVNNIIFSHRNM